MSKLREGLIAMVVGAGLAFPLLIVAELLPEPQGLLRFTPRALEQQFKLNTLASLQLAGRGTGHDEQSRCSRHECVAA